ncbi:PREDICTED: uncharacterized protein LOC108557961 [Nicrophorus vespilloides]|uniref:Uncharacterized protein LOC108557961 n=1 Tax=Nicrophorus vespilloides TaxID=110193 RepID=A0ABM1M6J9_NICVS|nr:PREDICTED: uncharacterized protein LOC108557961 [Nicrophorus vespilloides]
MSVEECFPRGGASQFVKKTRPTEPIIKNLFGRKEKETTAKQQWKKGTEEEEWFKSYINTQAKSDTADLLTYDTIKEGMLLLGCISKIQEFYATVELPGQIHGSLEIKSVSSRLNAELSRQIEEESDSSKIYKLNQILKIGSYIPVRINTIDKTNKLKTKVQLSCDPADVNWAFSHKDVSKYMLLWGSIAEKNDYNYVIDLGIKNCRVTLPFTNLADEEAKYVIGEPLYVISEKCDIQPEASIIVVTTKIDETKKNTGPKITLAHLIPSMKVNFAIEKVLADGLMGKMFDDNIAYINQIYLDKKLNSYKIGQIVTASVLYTQPMNKFTYFTLRTLKPTQKLIKGDHVRGIVSGASAHGLLIKINNIQFGLVRPIPGKNSVVREYMTENYPLGSDHECIVLSYHSIDNVYECAFSKEISNYPELNYKLGQTVKARVTGFVPSGMYVKIDSKVVGFIKNMHLVSERYTEAVNGKFNIGQTIEAKILKFTENMVDLTMKPEMLSCNSVFGDINDPMDKQYVGVVVSIYPTGVLVVFYGNAKGFLPIRNGKNGDDMYIGKAVKCFIKDKKNSNVTLMMVHSFNLFVGDKVPNAEIVEINNFGLKLSSFKYRDLINLPIGHVASRDIGQLVFNTFKVGDVVEDLLVLHKQPEIISRREFNSMALNHSQFPSIKKKGDTLVRGSITVKNSTHVTVTFPYKEKPEGVNVEMPIDEVSKTLNDVEEANDDSIVAKTNNHSSFNFQLEYGVDYTTIDCINYLELYLNDLEYLRKRLEITQIDVASIKIGDRIECNVDSVDKESNTILKVNADGYQGMVHHSELKKSPKAGKKINCTVIAIDYGKKIVHLTLKNSLNFDEIESKNCLKNTKVKMDVVHANSEYCVGIISDGVAKGKHVYLPVKLHDNDFEPKVDHYKQLVGQSIDVIIYRISGKNIMGFELSQIKPELKASAIKEAPKTLNNNKKSAEVEENVNTAQKTSDVENGQTNEEKSKQKKGRKRKSSGGQKSEPTAVVTNGDQPKQNGKKRKLSVASQGDTSVASIDSKDVKSVEKKPNKKKNNKKRKSLENSVNNESSPAKPEESKVELNGEDKTKKKRKNRKRRSSVAADEKNTSIVENGEAKVAQTNEEQPKQENKKSKSLENNESSPAKPEESKVELNGEDKTKRRGRTGRGAKVAQTNEEQPKQENKKSKSLENNESSPAKPEESKVELNGEDKTKKKRKNRKRRSSVAADEKNTSTVENGEAKVAQTNEEKNKKRKSTEAVQASPVQEKKQKLNKKTKSPKKNKKPIVN